MSTQTRAETGKISPKKEKEEEATTQEPATTTPIAYSRRNRKASAAAITIDDPNNTDQEPTTTADGLVEQQPDSQSQEVETPPSLQCSQISVGGEDDQLRMLDRSGDLANVIGSQSILSQELMDLNPSQREGLFVIHREDPSEATETATTTATPATKSENDEDSVHDSASPPPPQVDEIPSSQLSVNGFSQLSFLMDAAQAIEAGDSQKVVADILLETNNETEGEGMDEDEDEERPRATQEEPSLTKPTDKAEPAVDDKQASHDSLPRRIRPTRPPAMPDPETEDMKARVDTLIQKALAENDNDDEEGAPDGTNNRKRSGESKPESAVKRHKKGEDVAVAAGARDGPDGKSQKGSTNGNGKTDSNSDGLTPFQQRKRQKQQDQKQAQELAQQAADLAAQIIAHPHVAKQLLLTMALRRINPRAAPSTWPAKGTVIEDGFFWGTYPPLEAVLRANMRSYYDLSTKMCQSKDQQAFNNELTDLIRQEASRHGWEFDPGVFTDKVLRDRIRCFFKTHIQNSKKRLRTLIKNPTKKANAKALVAHLELIQTYSGAEGEGDEENFLNGTPATKKTTDDATTEENKAEMARQAAKNYKHLTEEEHVGLPAPRKNEVSGAKRKSVASPATSPSSPAPAKQKQSERTPAHRRRGRPKKRSRAEQEAAESVMALVASAAAASSNMASSGTSTPRTQSASPVANPIGHVEAL